MNPWNPEHPHHAVWREYTQSLLDGKPKVVEFTSSIQTNWGPTVGEPAWLTRNQYRIARPMLKLSYEVPMPVTEPLGNSQEYWIAWGGGGVVVSCRWSCHSVDYERLRAGLVYLTESDAQAAIDAHLAAKTAALEGAK